MAGSQLKNYVGDELQGEGECGWFRSGGRTDGVRINTLYYYRAESVRRGLHDALGWDFMKVPAAGAK